MSFRLQSPRFAASGSPRNRRAFSLVELLAVIAIIGVLAAVLLAVLGRVRNAARQTGCVSNLRQLGAAALLLTQETRGLMPYHFGFPIVEGMPNNVSGQMPWSSLLRHYVDRSGLQRREREWDVCPAGTRTDISDHPTMSLGGAMGYGMNAMVHANYRQLPPVVFQNGVRSAPAPTATVVNIRRLPNPSRTVLAMDYRHDGMSSVPENEIVRIEPRHEGRVNILLYDGSVATETGRLLVGTHTQPRWTGH